MEAKLSMITTPPWKKSPDIFSCGGVVLKERYFFLIRLATCLLLRLRSRQEFTLIFNTQKEDIESLSF